MYKIIGKFLYTNYKYKEIIGIHITTWIIN